MNAYDAARLDRQAQGLRRLARALVRDPHAADDLVQDTFVVALRNGGLPAMAWLRGVLRNRARERNRAESRRQRREERALSPSPAPRPDETAAHIDEQRRVAEALKRVGEPFRTTLWLRYFAGRSAAAIAREQGIAIATVRTRVHRGLELLRTELDRAHGDGRTWRLLLLPFVPQSVLGGGMAASKWKLGWAAVLLALVGGGAFVGWQLTARDDTTDREPAPQLHAEGETEAADEDAPAAQLEGRTRIDAASSTVDVAAASATATGRWRGRVVAAEGTLPRPVSVYVVAKDAPMHLPPERRVSADETGAFAFEMASIEGHWVAARAPTHPQWHRAFVDGDALVPGKDIELVLRKAPERVIRVHVPEGHAKERVQVAIMPMDPESIRAWPRPEDASFYPRSLRTDANGVCRFRLATRRAFRVRANAERLVAAERVVQPHEREIDLHLDRSAVIRIRIENWKPGDMPVSAMVQTEDPFAALPVHAGMQLDGTIVVDRRLPPGVYDVQLHSPAHETATIEGVRVTDFGEELELTATLRPKEGIGSMRLEIVATDGTRLPDGTEVFVFWRSHTHRIPVWRTRGRHRVADGHVSIISLSQGEHDVYVVPFRSATSECGAAHGSWVRDGERTDVTIRLAKGTMRKMPEVETRDMRGARLLHEWGELPVFFVRPSGSQIYMEVFPPAGIVLGPYPQGTLELEAPSKGGIDRHPLKPLGS